MIVLFLMFGAAKIRLCAVLLCFLLFWWRNFDVKFRKVGKTI